MNHSHKDSASSRVALPPRLMLALAVAIFVALILVWKYEKSASVPHQPTPLLSLEKVGQLVALNVHFADVIEFNESKALGIPWSSWEVKYSGTRVLLVARGDCSISTDLSTAKMTFHETEKTVLIALANPHAISARINHDSREMGGSYLYAVNGRGIEVLNPSAGSRIGAIDKAMVYAQKEVLRSCEQPAMIALARQNAEAVLRVTILASGWTPRFSWSKS
jgi:hypothetical protein